MGIYFEEEHERSRWESGQAILHRGSVEKQKEKDPQKDNETYHVRNSYGTLRYLRKERKRDGKSNNSKEGFVVEAFEAPGTPVHTEKEKHLNRQTMKKIRQNDRQALFASETPLRDQALFFDMKSCKRSTDLLQYMKDLLRRQGHQTLKDTFGFLDQEPERQELDALKSCSKDSLSPEESQSDRQLLPEARQDTARKRIDTLNSRLLRKEAKERQLCSELQLMLDQRTRKEFTDDHQNLSQKEQEAPQKDKDKRSNDSPKKHIYPDPEMSEATAESEDEDDEAPKDSGTKI